MNASTCSNQPAPAVKRPKPHLPKPITAHQLVCLRQYRDLIRHRARYTCHLNPLRSPTLRSLSNRGLIRIFDQQGKSCRIEPTESGLALLACHASDDKLL